MRIRRCVAMIGCGLLAVRVLPALAALGDNVASVSKDRVHLHAQLKGVTSSVGFTVHEIEAPAGTLIRVHLPERHRFRGELVGAHEARPAAALRQLLFAIRERFEQRAPRRRYSPALRSEATRSHRRVERPHAGLPWAGLRPLAHAVGRYARRHPLTPHRTPSRMRSRPTRNDFRRARSCAH